MQSDMEPVAAAKLAAVEQSAWTAGSCSSPARRGHPNQTVNPLLLQEASTREYQHPQGLRLLERSVWSDRMVFVKAVSDSGWMSPLEQSVYNSWCVPLQLACGDALAPACTACTPACAGATCTQLEGRLWSS